MLASGGDDSLVLVWDLIHQNNGAMLNGNDTAGAHAPHHHGGSNGQVQQKGPYASWRCDYEVANLSWSPQSALTAQGGEWLGVCGGRGIWGVKL
jgi:DDB1- and CUL4-associated factor 7